jgi:hypothetical protein
VNQQQIEAGFDHVRAVRFMRAHRNEVGDPAFWRGLNPELTISDAPTRAQRRCIPVDPGLVELARRQLVSEGYLQAPPMASIELVSALRRAAGRVFEAGFPGGFTCVYDEFFQLFERLDGLFAPLLGEGYRLVLHRMWSHFVPAGDNAYHPWRSIAPHRDTPGPDPRVLARDVPSIINVWIPLTDVTPVDSCLYVVPAPCDPDYYSTDRAFHPERIRFQDVRALPAAAGSVLGWSSHLAHWGSRSSPIAVAPRMSATVYFQRRDAAATYPPTVEFGDPIPFEMRIACILESIGLSDLAETTG